MAIIKGFPHPKVGMGSWTPSIPSIKPKKSFKNPWLDRIEAPKNWSIQVYKLVPKTLRGKSSINYENGSIIGAVPFLMVNGDYKGTFQIRETIQIDGYWIFNNYASTIFDHATIGRYISAGEHSYILPLDIVRKIMDHLRTDKHKKPFKI